MATWLHGVGREWSSDPRGILLPLRSALQVLGDLVSGKVVTGMLTPFALFSLRDGGMQPIAEPSSLRLKFAWQQPFVMPLVPAAQLP